MLPLADALAGRLVGYSPEAPQSAAIDAWLAQHRIEPDVAVEVRSGYAACSMAAAGVGVAFVDDLSARAHRAEGIVLKPVPKAPRFAIYTVVNVNRPLSAAGREFLAMVRAELARLQRKPLAHGGG